MGIIGARALMDSDPSRFCAEFTWGYDVDGKGTSRNNNEHNTLGLLVDAKSLLEHVAFQLEDVIYASPSTINDQVQIHIHRLLRVVGRQGGVHIFFDGLAPREQILSQLERLGEQASTGERLATTYVRMVKNEDPSNYDMLVDNSIHDPPSKHLHHLAEWTTVEAVDRLRQRFTSTLHMHRASVGETEALINQWLIQNDGSYSRVAVLSDDTDFLVYDSCPGFVPPSTLVYEERNGQHCLRGRYYLRSRFLRFFPGEPTTMDSSVMTTVAALSGCDYCTTADQAEEISKIRTGIVTSDIGGLPHSQRTNPTMVDALVAILRGVVHFKKISGVSWLAVLCTQLTTTPQHARTALNGLQIIHDVYTYSLQVASNSVLDLVPGMVEVRRLLQHGVMYCYPVVETFNATMQSKKGAPSSFAPAVRHVYKNQGGFIILPCPPLTTQMAVWSSRSSVWQFPSFKQIRTRLYSYVRLLVYHGRAPSSIPPGDFWTSSAVPIVEEIVRMKSGKHCGVERTHVWVPEHSRVSAMFSKDVLLWDDDLAVDRALVFCILGAPHQLQTIRGLGDRGNGVLFLASIMLPFNLAFLLLMMATAPREIVNFPIHTPAYDSKTCAEVFRVLPMLSVACAHANFLVNTIVAFWPDKALHSYLVLPPINVGATFRHDNALIIWDALRECRNLEYLGHQELLSSLDHNIPEYVANCFAGLRRLRPQEDQAWETLLDSWQERVEPIFDCWWEVFNLDGIDFPGNVQEPP